MADTIVVLPGDGVGPEVTAEACKVLQAVSARFDRPLDFAEGSIGGSAIDQTGSPLPDDTLALCQASSAVMLGAVGGPRWDDPQAAVRPEQGLLGLRKSMGLYGNLRPVKVHPALAGSGPLRRELVEGVDLLVVRELTGGIYFGQRGREDGPDGERAFDTMAYSTNEIVRIVRLAAQAAQKRHGRLVSVDKANVLEVSRLWRSVTQKVIREEFPDVTCEHLLVDAAAMHLIQKPARFDVIVTGNLFGDILTDVASVLAGSMGMLPSASVGGDGPGLYEPIHGSAPDIAGRGVANPIGMILSSAMMCRESLNWPEAADCIELAVDRALSDGARTVDIAGPGDSALNTSQMGDLIAENARQVETPVLAG